MTNASAKAAILMAALLTGSAASAQVYRWTDENGKVHFGDAPSPSGARKVEKQQARSTTAPTASEPYVLQVARKSNPVSLYTSPDCGAGCNDARDYLNKRGIPFTEISVTNNAKIDELKKVSGGSGVPAMLVGKSVHKGFEVGMYEAALDAAGYPRIGVLPARSAVAPAMAPAPGDKPAADKAEEPARPKGPYAPR